ncbi:hypothetical protein E4U14_008297, partial [Claviceps sp. LM454 group G7]
QQSLRFRPSPSQQHPQFTQNHHSSPPPAQQHPHFARHNNTFDWGRRTSYQRRSHEDKAEDRSTPPWIAVRAERATLT